MPRGERTRRDSIFKSGAPYAICADVLAAVCNAEISFPTVPPFDQAAFDTTAGVYYERLIADECGRGVPSAHYASRTWRTLSRDHDYADAEHNTLRSAALAIMCSDIALHAIANAGMMHALRDCRCCGRLFFSTNRRYCDRCDYDTKRQAVRSARAKALRRKNADAARAEVARMQNEPVKTFADMTSRQIYALHRQLRNR